MPFGIFGKALFSQSQNFACFRQEVTIISHVTPTKVIADRNFRFRQTKSVEMKCTVPLKHNISLCLVQI